MEIDSFLYLSPLITRYYKLSHVQKEIPIAWTPLKRPLRQARFALVTTGGLYHQGHDQPFDLERERREPPWGDPTYRTLPCDVPPADVGVSHFHINTQDVAEDMNILLPLQRFQELAENGEIGSLAPHAYSFMGYQGFPANLTAWRETYAPRVAQKMLAEGVECVFLSTA